MKRKCFNWLRKMKHDPALKIILGCLFVIVGAFVVIFLLDFSNLPTDIKIVDPANSREWLGHLVGYVGAVVGAFLGSVATLLAVRMTIDKQEKNRREDNAKDVLPLIEISNYFGHDYLGLGSMDYGDEKDNYVMLHFTTTNVGEREMYSPTIRYCYVNGKCMKDANKILSPIIYKNKEHNYCYSLKIDLLKNDYDCFELFFDIYFSDCYENLYCQKIKCRCERHSSSNFFDAEQYEVISAPQIVRE